MSNFSIHSFTAALFVFFFLGLDLLLLLYRLLLYDRGRRLRQCGRLPVGTPAAILGRIKAPDAERAVEEWIEKFGIPDPQQQQRLVARPVK